MPSKTNLLVLPHSIREFCGVCQLLNHSHSNNTAGLHYYKTDPTRNQAPATTITKNLTRRSHYRNTGIYYMWYKLCHHSSGEKLLRVCYIHLYLWRLQFFSYMTLTAPPMPIRPEACLLTITITFKASVSLAIYTLVSISYKLAASTAYYLEQRATTHTRRAHTGTHNALSVVLSGARRAYMPLLYICKSVSLIDPHQRCIWYRP